MTDGILLALLPVASSLATLIIQAVISNVNDKNKMRNELAIKIYDDRLNAYKKIYEALNVIRKHCVECNPEKPILLGYLINDFKDTFRSVELYIESESVKKFWELIQKLDHVDFCIRMGEPKKTDISLIEAKKTIELYIFHIKKVIGVEKLSIE